MTYVRPINLHTHTHTRADIRASVTWIYTQPHTRNRRTYTQTIFVLQELLQEYSTRRVFNLLYNNIYNILLLRQGDDDSAEPVRTRRRLRRSHHRGVVETRCIAPSTTVRTIYTYSICTYIVFKR